ncbi:MAG: sugar ABC transporter permease [Bdellovibrio sp. CG10_big_fil_rev_8_21_14_0_10_47_8]|nr:MAG: sugar ABC transporter permease [Bdellovibrio sp. CG10_big_fil_rev_8_21_14_0_10_47_8]
MQILSEIFSFYFLLSLLRGATPLIFASMAGLFSERSGLVQIGLEGMMLMGALFAAAGALATHSPWMGFILGGGAGLIAAAIYGFFAIELKSDQVVTGTALNLLAIGFAPFVTKILYDSTGSTPGLDLSSRFSFEPILIALLVSGVIYYLYHRSQLGIVLQFCGEEPAAVETAGYSVRSWRWIFILVCGFLAGLGGASLSLFLASSYSPMMTAGRGFIALAALIFGKWKPLPTLMACLFFATIEAIQIRLQGVDTGIPVPWMQALPYVITIVALAGFFGRSQAPKALGKI